MPQPADRIQFHQDPGQDARKDPNVLNYGFQVIGKALCIMQLNVEGLSASKRDIISAICTRENIDVTCLQETRVSTDKSSLFMIPGYDLLSYNLHAKHGHATYGRSTLVDCIEVSSHPFCDIV